MARALLLVLAAAVGGLPAAASPAACLTIPTLDDRCEAWVDSVDSPGTGRWGEDSAADVVLAGGRAITAGGSYPEGVDWKNYDALVVAHDPATGARLWTDRYVGPSGGPDAFRSIAASPDGSRVFAAGFTDIRTDDSVDPTCGSVLRCEVSEYLLVAYDAATGARRWVAEYNGADLEDHGRNEAFAVEVDPGGSVVYITGTSCATPGVVFVGNGPMSCDAVTLAYDASTGTELWRARATPDRVDERPLEIAATEGTVVVTGWRRQGASVGETDLRTVAYRSSGVRAGEELWARSDDGGVRGTDLPEGLVVSGGRALVAASVQASTGTLCAVYALDLGSGATGWTTMLRGPAGAPYDMCRAAGIAAGDQGIFLAGTSDVVDSILPSDGDHLLAALDPQDGGVRWIEMYGFPGANVEGARDVALTPDGASVVVTGSSSELYHTESSDIVTHAYDAATSDRRWVARFSPQNGRTGGIDVHYPERVVTDGTRIIVAGSLGYRPDTGTLPQGSLGSSDLGLLAYLP